MNLKAQWLEDTGVHKVRPVADYHYVKSIVFFPMRNLIRRNAHALRPHSTNGLHPRAEIPRHRFAFALPALKLFSEELRPTLKIKMHELDE